VRSHFDSPPNKPHQASVMRRLRDTEGLKDPVPHMVTTINQGGYFQSHKETIFRTYSYYRFTPISEHFQIF
jgi:hypothetical protein